jgi:uncharacterized membrane-anchored protein YjiN (DUF445 family)
MMVTDDFFKEASLRKMRRFATLLLLLMCSIFLGAHFYEQTYGWLSYVRAFAEAAIVGALADWFAVTALFRHPFGLPLPHTAIIPANKDRIGASLGNFVQKNFLTPEAIKEKLQAIDIAGKGAQWLSKPENAELITTEVLSFIPKVLDALNDDDVKRFIKTNAASAIRTLNLASFTGEFLTLLTSHHKHQVLFDQAMIFIADLFDKYKPELHHKIKKESNLVFFLLGGDTILYNKIVTAVGKTLEQITSDPEHGFRRKFDEATENFINELRSSPEYRDKIEELREDILQNPAVARYLENVWSDIKASVLDDIKNPESVVSARLKEAINAVYTKILADTRVREKINGWILTGIINSASKHRNEISKMIAARVKKWDTETMSRKLELEVGKDLQYIRINGTVIGGCIGLLMHSISLIF